MYFPVDVDIVDTMARAWNCQQSVKIGPLAHCFLGRNVSILCMFQCPQSNHRKKEYMKSLHVTTTETGMDEWKSAAEYRELPLSLWARDVLHSAARSTAHKKLCSVKTGIEYKTPMGEPCTKEEYEAQEKRLSDEVQRQKKFVKNGYRS
jgi:hypothetical protein